MIVFLDSNSGKKLEHSTLEYYFYIFLSFIYSTLEYYSTPASGWFDFQVSVTCSIVRISYKWMQLCTVLERGIQKLKSRRDSLQTSSIFLALTLSFPSFFFLNISPSLLSLPSFNPLTRKIARYQPVGPWDYMWMRLQPDVGCECLSHRPPPPIDDLMQKISPGGGRVFFTRLLEFTPVRIYPHDAGGQRYSEWMT